MVPSTDLLLIVDVQNDFLPGGRLAVPEGEAVIAPVNALAARFRHVVLTQDWHPPGHVSFASSHPGRVPLEVVTLPGGRSQVLWPDHCLQGTAGAALAAGLSVAHAAAIFRKGGRVDLDSYSAFVEADGETPTGLAGYCRERGVGRVVVAGLAADFCVAATAIDARRAGFPTTVVADATRGVGTGAALDRAWSAMRAAGVVVATCADVLGG